MLKNGTNLFRKQEKGIKIKIIADIYRQEFIPALEGQKMKYVLIARKNKHNGVSDGYYTGKSYIYQGSKYAIVEGDITKAKIYSSEARAIKASEMSFENYIFYNEPRKLDRQKGLNKLE